MSNVSPATEMAEPNYFLSEEQLAELNVSMADRINGTGVVEEDLYSVWVGPNDPHANIVRTGETHFWPDMSEIMGPHEQESRFLILYDRRDGLDKAVHGFRISSVKKTTSGEGEALDDDQTGLVLIDDIINSDQGFTAKEFRDYYADRGFDVSKFVTVETNFRIEKAQRYNGLPPSQVGYISLFLECERAGAGPNEAAIFAALNKVATLSLKAAGIVFEPLAGRDDLRIPLTEGKFDDHYTAVAIPSSLENLETTRALIPLAAPAIHL